MTRFFRNNRPGQRDVRGEEEEEGGVNQDHLMPTGRWSFSETRRRG